jgi:hypothetical protein
MGKEIWIIRMMLSGALVIVTGAVVTGAVVVKKPAPVQNVMIVREGTMFCSVNGKCWFPVRDDGRCYAADAP